MPPAIDKVRHIKRVGGGDCPLGETGKGVNTKVRPICMPQDGANTNRAIFVGVVTHPQPAAGEYINKANPSPAPKGKGGNGQPFRAMRRVGMGVETSALHASGFKAYHYARLP